MDASRERPELLAAELWHYDWPNSSTIYLHIEGEGPLVTNHLSELRFNVVSGNGQLSTREALIRLRPYGEVTLRPATTYSYSGRLAMLLTATPALTPAFVTFGADKLGNFERRILRKVARAERLQAAQEYMLQLLTGGCDFDTVVNLLEEQNVKVRDEYGQPDP